MACTGRFAEAWQFASFFCVGAMLYRVDDSGGMAHAFLTDSQADFVTGGIKANVGMILYNVTDGSRGPVTAVTTNTLTASLAGGVGNNWDNGDVYRIVTIDTNEIATIQNYLDITATDIHAAMAAADACSCTLASWASALLGKINIIEAAGFYQCPCGGPRMTDEMRKTYMEWADHQLELIRLGKIEVCAGSAGSDYPAVGWAEQTVTEFATEQILFNAWRRSV